MSKPIKPTVDEEGEGYLVDAVLQAGMELPEMVMTNLRHLLLAAELGDLVVIQCVNDVYNVYTYVLCARVMASNNKSKLMPICELENTNAIMARMRPPLALANDAFVKPIHTGAYAVDVIEDAEGITCLAEVVDKRPN